MKEKNLKQGQIRVFVLCWVAYACIYFGRVNLSVALPDIQNTFGWSKGQIGIIGSLFLWVYGCGQLINGCIGDKWSSKMFIFLGLFVTALANILFGFAASLVVMVILWTFNGYFQSMLWGPMVKMLAYWFEHEKRSSIAIGISTSMVGGYLLAWGLSGFILEKTNWKWTFWVPGIVILIYAFIWIALIKNHPKEIGLKSPNMTLSENKSKQGERNQDFSLWEVIVKTKLWFVVIACFAQGIIKDGIALWAPTLLMETQKLDIKSTVQFIIFIPIMNFFGMMLAGRLNKKFNEQEKLTTIILFALGILMIIGFVKCGSYNTIIALIFLGLSSAMMYGANTLLLGVIPLNFARYNRASSIAGFLDFCSYLAAGSAVLVTGIIVDKVGWNGVMVFWCVGALVGIIALLISWKYDNIQVKNEISKAVVD